MINNTTGPILDIHHHIGPRDRLSGTDEDYDFEAAAEKHLRVMDDYGIAEACLIASHNARISGTDDVRWLNTRVAEVTAAHPDRFVACAGTVDPGLGADGIKEVEFCARELGMNALAWHARFAGMPIDSPSIARYVQVAADLDTPIMMHMMAESNWEAPWRLVRIAEQVPNARILALDAFTALHQVEWVLAVGAKVPNVIFETAFLRSCSMLLEKLVASHGAEQIVFGSGYYDDTRTRAPGALSEFAAMDISDDDLRLMVRDNARQFLGLA
jgi:predicted TIM-barrel fold metal-dependent hydrolase